ncbi:MAG: Glutamate synthase [NADPH] large chain [Firmicutes bacterium]|nr:Glutamate synthase [NADPH] large chain [Bacillota bacterium]
MLSFLQPEFLIQRDKDRCNSCGLCVKQCSFEVHQHDKVKGTVLSDETKCICCHRCVTMCPTRALSVRKNTLAFRRNSNWTVKAVREIYKQAETGGILLSGMGNPEDYPIYWDRIVINASQVTNPPIDPLREPMELKTFLGRKPERVDIDANGNLQVKLPPQLELEAPILFSAMSFGSISFNACKALAMAAAQLGIYYNAGEGGLHKDLYNYSRNTIAQVASGRFGINIEYLNACSAVEIKMGQGAKPGIGGHLPGEKVNEEISKTRMIPVGSDALSPAPHHDIYSIEDLKQLIYLLRETTGYAKPIAVKVAAVNNISSIASGIVRAGADIIVIDGFRGGTGAAPTRIRDNVGIPIEMAVASVDTRLKNEGIRSQVSIIASGSMRNSADIIKAIALGADAVYIATGALIALGCHVCQKCYTGKCSWGIATQNPDLVKRLNPDIGSKRLINLITAWINEIKEFLGGMGINSIDSLRGNRDMLRGIGLNQKELDILGIKTAGE